jgi:hypothetical protein
MSGPVRCQPLASPEQNPLAPDLALRPRDLELELGIPHRLSAKKVTLVCTIQG